MSISLIYRIARGLTSRRLIIQLAMLDRTLSLEVESPGWHGVWDLGFETTGVYFIEQRTDQKIFFVTVESR